MKRWIHGLTWAGTVMGALLIVYGFARFLLEGLLPALFIALAVVLAGPVEDGLQRWVRQRVKDPGKVEEWTALIDRATSLLFLLSLVAAVAVVT